jgi:type IV secretion system protein VirB10
MKDKVNNHYLRFWASLPLALSPVPGDHQGGGTISQRSQAFTTGAAGSVSQSATTILDRFMQIPPAITIHEGHRVKGLLPQDMLLPAYEKRTIPQTV